MTEYFVSADKNLLDIDFIHRILSKDSYWAQGRSKETILKSINHSVCFGVYLATGQQVGFARVLTDYAVFFYLMDVCISSDQRGKGLFKMLMNYIMAMPDLQNLQRYMLATKDAHALYFQYGFKTIEHPEWFMEIVNKPN